MNNSTLAERLQKHVDAGQIAGAVASVWQNGRQVQDASVGWRDIENGVAMTPDTIFRIASLSKPVTSVAALMLYDQGKFALDDPISRWAPEFADMKVLTAPDAELTDVVPAQRPINFADLLTHCSGISNGGFHAGPIGRAYEEALGADLDSVRTPDDWIARLARLPLIDQPGAGFHYGNSTDLLGFLVARMAGKTLGETLEELIFAPLGMTDTSFNPPPQKRARTAKLYGFDAEGRLQHRPIHPPHKSGFLAERPADMTFVSGAAGLWSTASDYMKFARLFVEDGASANVRVLKPQTLRLMTQNALTDAQRMSARLLGSSPFAAHGFGLGVATVLDPAKAPVVRGKGGIGTVGWPGAYGGWWQADPTNGKVMVFLAHNALDLERLADGIGLGVYAAIEDFYSIAKN